MGKGAFQNGVDEAVGPGAHALGSDVERVHCLSTGATAISPALAVMAFLAFLMFCFSGFDGLAGFLGFLGFLGLAGDSATTY